MPSIYSTLKSSDRKHIRTEKARIRRQFFDRKKQAELITELYKKMVPALREKSEIRNSRLIGGQAKLETNPEGEANKKAKPKSKKVAAKSK